MIEFSREEYKQKIGDISDQIIQNWCLLRHYRLNCNEERCEHYSNELKFLLTIANICAIKDYNSIENTEWAITEVWTDNEYFDCTTMMYVIIMKFHKEKIDTETPEFWNIIDDCIASHNTLIHLIAVGDINALYNYVDTI